MATFPMTKEGFDSLTKTLEHLKTIERPAIIEAISHARELGDLKENAEYHSAKDRQGLIEAKIKQLESKLSQAQVIDISKMDNDGKVIFGCTVTILNTEDEQSMTITLVGEDEADLTKNKLSVQAPLARSLIGKYEGDSVDTRTPKGLITYEITEVLYT